MSETVLQRSRRIPAGQKALFHQETGAGKSRIKRPFFGLAPEDETWLEHELGTALDVNLRRGEGQG